MEIDDVNTYIDHKEGKLFTIKIELDDKSRNYLHCNPQPIDKIIFWLDDLIGQKIGNWNTRIDIDENYYRIKTILRVGKALNGENDTDLEFHSRKLNLSDAVFEYRMITKNVK